jgi:hypothetical protein
LTFGLGQGLRQACCQAKLLEVFIAAPIKQRMLKKRNGKFSEIEKRLQVQNALAAESSAGLRAVFVN